MELDFDPNDFDSYAQQIWNNGKTKSSARLCFVPSDFGGNDDLVIDKYELTHYDLDWETHGKTVRINLYCGDSFGACLDPEFKGYVIVDVSSTC